MKNVIKTIDLKTNQPLYQVALAMNEIQLMRKVSLDTGMKEPKSITSAMNAIVDLLIHKFQYVFIKEFPQYAENKMAFGQSHDGNLEVKVFGEKYDKTPENCDDCNNESVGISDMLKENGLETSDDYVERLTDNLHNKKGGQA